MAIEVFAPAKVNLALHVTGQRADGYHLLDSLVVFAGVGDEIRASQDDTLRLHIVGSEAAGLTAGDDNLVFRAARVFASDRGAAITLIKDLPVSSGIGGGSADAAATLKALAQLWGETVPTREAALALGADVPVCLNGPSPQRMRGIGEQLDPFVGLPGPLAMVLVNPRVAVSTPEVFKALSRKDNPPLEEVRDGFGTIPGLIAWLKRQRNDLEAPAIAKVPVIGEVLRYLTREGCLLARMSGSGATCFGIFDGQDAARDAARRLREAHPGWWIRETVVIT
ncbi:4-(cytidine 5'-diphospho)-2-C-methyl-D-erythritol kinase [Defluviimonas sp. WL0050]|uniref:4-diphosphocytidyl-2-C-methyl-D-erythritol kinase n=1 Tax=Albidovulum litorale TaxID=2984134 RepID=A0ABT2ZT08_9RHOB|nr:4-(cytidine 5'-diphospho)-2-C-methyl-D-erythritol kinase [Defluviimonas sp. WL0050]MCV2874090.1 4-(cytidine 5'-diphospho)-2-C-methyl-D-erythritol kinase [Defluviimonas sp. WL0050]